MFISLMEIKPILDIEELYNQTIYGNQSRLIMLLSNILKKTHNEFKEKAKQIYSNVTAIIVEKYRNESIKNREGIFTAKGKINQIKN